MEINPGYDAGLDEDAVIDWDGTIENDGEEFTVLPDGDTVEFYVDEVKFRRNAKNTAPQVQMKLVCKSINGHGNTSMNEFITMTKKSEWKLCQFFRSLGLRQHGEPLKLRWNIIGFSGHATVSIDEYTDKQGELRQSNKIKAFLDPAEPRISATDEDPFA